MLGWPPEWARVEESWVRFFLSWSLKSSEAYADKMYHLFVLRIIHLNIFCNKRNKSHWRIYSWYSLWFCIQHYLFHKMYCPLLYAYRVDSFYHKVHICWVYCKIYCYVFCELICLRCFCPYEMQPLVAAEKPASFFSELYKVSKCLRRMVWIFGRASVYVKTKGTLSDCWLVILERVFTLQFIYLLKLFVNKGNNKITELRTILQRESQSS
jgi:hypothetical protein